MGDFFSDSALSYFYSFCAAKILPTGAFLCLFKKPADSEPSMLLLIPLLVASEKNSVQKCCPNDSLWRSVAGAIPKHLNPFYVSI
jgi:hypothetical protein